MTKPSGHAMPRQPTVKWRSIQIAPEYRLTTGPRRFMTTSFQLSEGFRFEETRIGAMRVYDSVDNPQATEFVQWGPGQWWGHGGLE